MQISSHTRAEINKGGFKSGQNYQVCNETARTALAKGVKCHSCVHKSSLYKGVSNEQENVNDNDQEIS